MLLLIVAEFVVHYHTDWLKSKIDAATGWPSTDVRHWMVFGADQLIHQLTYLAIVALLIARGPGLV